MSLGVTGTASPDAIIAAVEAAGYGASKKSDKGSKESSASDESLKDTETPKMRKRLIASIVLLLPLMYVAMGLYQLLLSGLIMVINQKFFISGFKGLLHRSPNMDTLVSLGATASYAYSVVALFAMTGAVVAGDSEQVMYYMDQFYF